MATDYPLRISTGTQVLAGRKGVGVVVGLQEGEPARYRVRFPSGEEGDFDRGELRLRKLVVAETLGPPVADSKEVEDLLANWVIYRCVTGSRAYGLDEAESDTDVRGVFVAPPEILWSLQGAPEYLERGQTEESYWELRKFCILALKANPNILECLYTPLVEQVSPMGQELLSMRDAFLSRMVHQTFNGYVLSQFKKIERDLRSTGSPKWKHVMHLLRLLLSGVAALREGTLSVEVGGHRERLLAVRRGEVPWEEIEEWRLRLHEEFDEALVASPLPDLPDFDKVNRYLVAVRQRTALGTRP